MTATWSTETAPVQPPTGWEKVTKQAVPFDGVPIGAPGYQATTSPTETSVVTCQCPRAT